MKESEELKALYAHRFSPADRAKKDRIWSALCEHYFQAFIGLGDTVLDLACGQGEFIRHIRCARKIAVDLNPEVRELLPPEIRYVCARADNLEGVESDTVDVCFVSNFFEHLGSKAEMNAVLAEIRRVLRSGGRLINLQPNVRYEPGRYWDFYDHVLPLSHLSAAEGLAQQGFELERVIPRFLPFTTKSAIPQHPLLVRAYLAFPPIWRVMGGQFLIVARKP
jgi:ubiquinone/menaquinone biosynthesis C-methylase UbiE